MNKLLGINLKTIGTTDKHNPSFLHSKLIRGNKLTEAIRQTERGFINMTGKIH